MYLQPKFFQWHPVLSRQSMDAVMPGCLLSEIRPSGGGIKACVVCPSAVTHNN